MSPVDLRTALRDGLVVWAGTLLVLFVAGLLTGVWRLADVGGAATDELVGPLLPWMAATTALLVGGPVVAYRWRGLVAPLVGLGLYATFWLVTGVRTGVGPVRAGFAALLYAGFGVGVVAGLALLELLVRWAGTWRLGA
ncbi:MAG: hypothetical protein ABEJ70_06415 [Halobacteriaceae archaeon]